MNSSSTTYFDRHISESEAQQLLDTYGGNSANWPPACHDALSQAIASSPALQKAQQAALQLDALLNEDRAHEKTRSQTESTAQLAAKIIRELPARKSATAKKDLANQRLRFTLPDLRNWWPAPVMAAALVAVVITFLPSEKNLPNAAELAFEQWAWEDVTAQSLTPDNSAEIEEDVDLLLGLWKEG